MSQYEISVRKGRVKTPIGIQYEIHLVHCLCVCGTCTLSFMLLKSMKRLMRPAVSVQ